MISFYYAVMALIKKGTPMSDNKNTVTPREEFGENPHIRDVDDKHLPFGFYQIPGYDNYMINDKFEVRHIDSREKISSGRFGSYWAVEIVDNKGVPRRRGVRRALKDARKAAGL